MSKRQDIMSASVALSLGHGLIYTKILGWIDLGHAQANDARRLKSILLEEKGCTFFPEFKDWYFPVDYYQEMGANKDAFGHVIELRVGVHSPLMVRSCLSWSMKQRIALTIMMKTANRFEAFQQFPPFTLRSDSGFSGEDLVSDLVGFYRVFGAGIDPIILAQPTSKEYALWIWDHYGPVGNFKNKEFRPLLFPQPSPYTGNSPRKGLIPSWLNYIKPLPNLENPHTLNRYGNTPSQKFFNDSNRMNQELYVSMREKGWDITNGKKNTNMPQNIHIAEHIPMSIDFFTILNDY
ncbi:hypothetical protein OH773_03335 [Buttiauxella sp. WJP83]|uniref:hypothetical protein n=1 Tax=Buttiauxella sp. WJP83 TaxID=2986951 RepID=UPI0022DD60CD|nr:hypothetical protein [Buttiauxella sp. WJP83]WBM71313.1 hypothetical protein OH773_03335 [Buttiauxella sp. WJP83]